MNTVSSLAHASAGISGALLGEEGRTALDSAQPEMTISQMSRLFGVSLRTLRFYEDRGLIKPRREGNARYYRATDRVRMEMILKGKKLGFTLTEIQDLIGGKGASETDRSRRSAQSAADRDPDQPPGAAAQRDRGRDREAARDPKPPRPGRRRLIGRGRAKGRWRRIPAGPNRIGDEPGLSIASDRASRDARPSERAIGASRDARPSERATGRRETPVFRWAMGEAIRESPGALRPLDRRVPAGQARGSSRFTIRL